MSYANPKLRFTDTPYDTIAKLAAGSLAAETVLNRLIEESRWIDPDNAIGTRGAMYSLDGLDIYGERIVDFYRGVCGGDAIAALAMLRAVQIGALEASTLIAAIDAPDAPWTELTKTMVAAVKMKIPSFAARPQHPGSKISEFLEAIFGTKPTRAPAATPAEDCASCSTCRDQCKGEPRCAAAAAGAKHGTDEGADGVAIPPEVAAFLSRLTGVPAQKLSGATIVSMGSFRAEA